MGGNKKAALSGRSRKEAMGKGKSLRESDARCDPGLRQDTRIEEVSNLGRGLKSFRFYGLFCMLSLKQLANQRYSEGVWKAGHKCQAFYFVMIRD
jgi:hypothetical protein